MAWHSIDCLLVIDCLLYCDISIIPHKYCSHWVTFGSTFFFFYVYFLRSIRRPLEEHNNQKPQADSLLTDQWMSRGRIPNSEYYISQSRFFAQHGSFHPPEFRAPFCFLYPPKKAYYLILDSSNHGSYRQSSLANDVVSKTRNHPKTQSFIVP